MEFTATTFWIAAALVLGCAEMLVGTFYLLIVAIGALCAAYASYSDFTFEGQCTIFSLVIIFGGMAVTRARRYWLVKHPDAPNNLDAGQVVNVEEIRGKGTAIVDYRGTSWKASFTDVEHPMPGNYVIDHIDGTKLVLTTAEAFKNKQSNKQ